MARRASEPWTLMNEARKLWQESFTGEYIGDARDMREAKGFLETNPDFLGREDWREVLRKRWERYTQDKFWRNHDFPIYAFYMQFRKWAPPIEKRKPKAQPESMIVCSDCAVEGIRTVHSPRDYCPVCAKKHHSLTGG